METSYEKLNKKTWWCLPQLSYNSWSC